MRPDIRFIAAIKASNGTQANANVFLKPAKLPTVSNDDWKLASKFIEQLQNVGTQIKKEQYTDLDLQTAINKILFDERVRKAAIVLFHAGKDAQSVSRILARSSIGEFTIEALEWFRRLFWDISLMSRSQWNEFLKRLEPSLVDLLQRASNPFALIELGIIPEVPATEYLQSLVATGYKTLHDILTGKIQVDNPIELINAAIRASEVLTKQQVKDTDEFIEKLKGFMKIQTIQEEDKYLDQL